MRGYSSKESRLREIGNRETIRRKWILGQLSPSITLVGRKLIFLLWWTTPQPKTVQLSPAASEVEKRQIWWPLTGRSLYWTSLSDSQRWKLLMGRQVAEGTCLYWYCNHHCNKNKCKKENKATPQSCNFSEKTSVLQKSAESFCIKHPA